jgi:hypothetical protein
MIIKSNDRKIGQKRSELIYNLVRVETLWRYHQERWYPHTPDTVVWD